MHELASQILFREESKGLTEELCRERGWVLHAVQYPIIDASFTAQGRVPLRLRLTCNNWNSAPPSVELLALDAVPLLRAPVATGGQFHQGPHPITGKPFVCMRGTREYHTHFSHTDDLWEKLREGSAFTLGGIITQIWRAWQAASP